MNAPGPWVTIGWVAGVRAPRDGDLPGQNDGQAVTDLADFGQGVARRKRPEHAEAAEALDLRRLQSRKHLVSSRIDDRWRGHGHP
jgi:hypothetical protein